MEIGIFYDNVKEAFSGLDDLLLLEKVKEFGYSYIELNLEELMLKNDAFFQKSDALSIGFSVYAFSDEHCLISNGINAIETLPFLSEHHISHLMMVCKSANANKKTVNECIVSSLNRLCDEAEKYGIFIAVEDFDSHSIPCGNCDDMLFFGTQIPKLKYTFDTGNFAFFGDDALVCFESLKERIAHIHLKDRISMTDLSVVVTGFGSLPIAEIIHKLNEIGYNGKMSVEMFGASKNPEDLSKALQFVKGCLNKDVIS